MDKLIEYINTGSCLVFVGAGPSAEIDIPSWKSLARIVYDEVKKVDPTPNALVEGYFQQSRLPEFFGEISRQKGLPFLMNLCEGKVCDTGKRGAAYHFLSRFPFQAYLTTNYDHALRRHIRDAGISPSTFLNRPRDFQELDIDSLPKSIVKIHGDFSDPNTIVLTDEQYDSREVGNEYQYYRDAISSYFMTKRVLLVGYSNGDPDIQHILKRISINLRRKNPIYAIIADADQSTIREWDRKYNIQVLAYKNKSGTHRELSTLFEALTRYVYIDGPPPPARSEIDLRRAQSFYMWHRFQNGDETIPFKVDALKSVVFSTIGKVYKQNERFSVSDLRQAISSELGLEKSINDEALLDCLAVLDKKGFVVALSKVEFEVKQSLAEAVVRFTSQYDRLQSSFEGQVELDFQKTNAGIADDPLKTIKRAILDVIVDLFSERGIEIINMIFGKKSITTLQAGNLFRLIHKRSLGIQDQTLRYKFIAYVTEMLTSPTPLQETILEYYSKAFFSIQALELDPVGRSFRSEFLRNRTLIVDSNILIPLLAKSNAKQNVFENVLRSAHQNEVKLISTESIFQEVLNHAKWARGHVTAYGEQSEEVLSAAMGRAPYRRNAFLDGFIRFCTDVKHIDFDAYLSECFGGKITIESLKLFIEMRYGIKMFNFDTLTNRNVQSIQVRDSLKMFVMDKAVEAEISKDELRATCEAEAYTIIKFWNHLRPNSVVDSEWQCSFLSQGGFLNRIAKESEFPINGNLVIRIDALYEFLLRFGAEKRPELSFKEILLSTYFRAADYFVDKAKYRKFFTPLINEAEKIYHDGLQKFQEYINESLTSDYMDDVDDFEKPIIVKGLKNELSEVIKAKDLEIERLRSELKEKEDALGLTDAQLKEYKEKEQRMKKFADRQRKARERKRG